jgi:hypothetical protein
MCDNLTGANSKNEAFTGEWNAAGTDILALRETSTPLDYQIIANWGMIAVNTIVVSEQSIPHP